METAANIGPRERGKRLAFGLFMAGVAVAGLAGAVAAGEGRPWRVLLFIPAWFAVAGVLQWRRKT